MNDFQKLEFEIDGAVARIWLNQPDTRNAFDEVLIAELTEAIRRANAELEVRAIVLGARGRAFCAGANLHWMRRAADFTREQNLADAEGLAAMLRAIHESARPVVARVQGDAYAGGMGLVAASDIAVAVDTAGFCLSEVRIGLVPATISPYVLQAIGVRAARRWFLTAERFGADEARQLGLVHEVVTADRLDERVDAIVGALVAASPDAVRNCKAMIGDYAGRPIDDALVAQTVERIADVRASVQGREGIQAFLQKRQPSWQADA